MIGRLAALTLLTVYLIQTEKVPHQLSLKVVKVGENVTLQCPVDEKKGEFFYWYKERLGYTAQTVSSKTLRTQKLDSQFNNSRFKVTEEETQYFLSITNVSKDDEAKYFCHKGTAYSQSYVNGIFLAVDDRDQEKSFYVKQSPESVQPGDSVTLQCSLHPKNKENSDQCPGEHRVYWFRSGPGASHPGIIYTHSDEEEGRRCVYRLSKTIQNSSDNGTYYCAVVTCGEILLGEGTKVETRSKLDPVLIVLGVLLACCVMVIVVLIVCISRRRVCEHCKAGATSAARSPGHDRSTVDQPTDLDDDTEALNYAALNFSGRKATRVKKQRESAECVYSAVRADYQTQHRPR